MPVQIALDREAIAELCRRSGIRRLSLFGSVLRDDFRTDSDVDMLVEFQPDVRIGFFELVQIEMDLTDLIGRKIDPRSAKELSRCIRDEVVRSADPLYVAE